MKNFLLLTILQISFLTGFGQSIVTYKELTNASVIVDNQLLSSPFCGGINSAQPAHADLNNDGKKDITIFDFNTTTLKTFINTGQVGQTVYTYDPKYALHFPRVDTYLKLIDYNCDNIPDLITKRGSGFTLFKGKYNIQNELTFELYKELEHPAFPIPTGAYVASNDIPIVEDLDCDGDLDFASYNSFGKTIVYYKNLQVENNLPCDSVLIIEETNCFGKIVQNTYRTHALNAVCKGTTGNAKKLRHGSNCILSLDYDGDGILDLIGGNTAFTDAQLFINGGNCSNTLFTSQDSLFDADGHQLEMNGSVAPFYFDIDNDNDNDLVFTPHLDNTSSANYNAMAVYINNGTNAAPNFQWINDSFFVDQIIDIGRNSHPALFDYDKDGKKDLFVGGQGYFNTNSQSLESHISYFRNISTAGQVSFELITDDFLNLSAKSYLGLYPTFGDITGDGITDLVMGNDEGKIIIYENTAVTNNTIPNFNWLTDNYSNIDVGDNSFPLVYDFNGDNKTDLLVGCRIGTLWLYEDTSSTNIKELKRVDSAISGIRVGHESTFFSNSVPYIGSIDSSNKEYLLVGTSDGFVEIYDSFKNQHTNWSLVDTNMANLQMDTFYYNSYKFVNNKVAYRTAPVINDLDGDMKPDLIIGNQNGGLRVFQFEKNNYSVGSKNIAGNKIAIKLFPNPTQNNLWIKSPPQTTSIQAYKIIDISGRTVLQSSQALSLEQPISTTLLSNGLYFIEITFNDDVHAIGKFMKKN